MVVSIQPAILGVHASMSVNTFRNWFCSLILTLFLNSAIACLVLFLMGSTVEAMRDCFFLDVATRTDIVQPCYWCFY